jgi:hypothetical protein
MPRKSPPKSATLPPATVKRDSNKLASLAAPPAKPQPTKGRRAPSK